MKRKGIDMEETYWAEEIFVACMCKWELAEREKQYLNALREDIKVQALKMCKNTQQMQE